MTVDEKELQREALKKAAAEGKLSGQQVEDAVSAGRGVSDTSGSFWNNIPAPFLGPLGIVHGNNQDKWAQAVTGYLAENELKSYFYVDDDGNVVRRNAGDIPSTSAYVNNGSVTTGGLPGEDQTEEEAVSQFLISKYLGDVAYKEGDKWYINDPKVEGGKRELRYTATDAYGAVRALSGEQLQELRRKAWLSNWYGMNGQPKSWVGPANEEDLEIVSQYMADSEITGVDWWAQLNMAADQGEKYGRPMTPLEREKQVMEAATKLEEFAYKNGVDVSDEQIYAFQVDVDEGRTTIDAGIQNLRDNVLKVMYPGYEKEIDAGLNVEDFAQSYVSTASQILEDDIDLMDPIVQQALQGAEGERTPMWKFKEMVREDPRWEYTDNAFEEVDSMVAGLTRIMGGYNG